MRKWSIGKQLGTGFGGLVACILALGLVSVWAIGSLRDDLGLLGGALLKKSDISGSMSAVTQEVRAELRGIIAAAATRRPQDLLQARTNADQALSHLEALVGQINPLLTDPRAKTANASIAAVLPQWRASIRQIADLAAAGRIDAADKMRLAQAPMGAQIDQAVDLVRAIQREVAEKRLDEANKRASMNRFTILGFVGLSLALGAITFWMVRGLTATLRHTVKELTSGGEQVSSASGQIAATSQSLAQGASEQAASIEEVSASMEEMTAMTRRNADNSAEATAMMAETLKQVERSNTALEAMVASMSAIKISSEKVAKINKTIDEIAFQTNILALNAAVEAARAGEAGMGFAVVANEVRNLAQRSAVAAKDTAELIEESIANAGQGAERLDLVSVAILGITDSAAKVKNLLDEVNESSKQQGLGIQQASSAISQVSTVTQTAAASAEESAAASQELNAQSQTVRDLVQTLASMVEGAAAAERARVRQPVSATRRPVAAGTARSHHAAPKADDPFPMESVETGSFQEF